MEIKCTFCGKDKGWTSMHFSTDGKSRICNRCIDFILGDYHDKDQEKVGKEGKND